MHRVLQQSSKQLRAQAPRAYRSPVTLRSTAPFSTSIRALSHSDYGSGDPKAGPNPSEDQEHPGPPAPDTGNSSSSNTGKGRPTIHSDKNEQSSQQDESVKRHNEEMEKRQAKSHDKDGVNDPKDRVEKGYWKGEGDQ